jgi:DnaJ-class molecular chaperone
MDREWTRAECFVVLGLSENCTLADAKAQYKKLIRELHPDKASGGGCEEDFKRVQHAFEHLSSQVISFSHLPERDQPKSTEHHIL